MKGPAQYILFVFAIFAVTVILVMWSRQDGLAAMEELKTIYSADVTIVEERESVDGQRIEEEFIVGCNSEKLIDLEAFSKVLNRAGNPTVLDLTGCPNLTSFRGVDGLSSLKSIIAIDCPKLISADGVTGLPNLSELVLLDSQRFFDASAVRELPALRTIDMSGCLSLKELDVSRLPALQDLYVSRCRELAAIDLTPCPNLQQFYADGCAALAEIGGLGRLEKLTDLDVSNCDLLSHLNGLPKLKNLVVLNIRNVQLRDFQEVATLSSLRILRLGGQENLETLEPFAALTGLREIHLEACPNFHSLKGLPASVSQYAGFTFCPKLKSLSGLSAAKNLEQLDVSGCDTLSDLAGLEKMANLVQLSLTKCRQVTDINRVRPLKKLVIVLLGGSGVVPASIKELKQEMKNTSFDFLLAEQ